MGRYSQGVIIESDDIDTLNEFSPNPVVSGLHVHQTSCFYDPSRFRCALAGRQSGKSHLDAAWLLGGEPGQTSLYFARSITSAWSIMFSVFHELNSQYDLGLTVLKGEAQVIEPNGHVIQLYGVKDQSAAENLRGRKFRRIVGDEAGTFHSELLQYTVQDVLQPTLMKHSGELMLSGTPGIEPEGYFYELTGDPFSGVKGRWPTHHWTLMDNPHLPHESVVKDILAQNFWTTEHPTFLREYLARWVADRGALVYDFGGHFEPRPESGTTVLGIDFGFDPDKTAFTVIRQGERPHIHVLKSFGINHLTPHTIADIVASLRNEFHPNYIVADEGALGKGYAAELKEQFHLPIEPAQKRDKKARIELLRGIIACGQLHVCEGSQELLDEWKTLPWGDQKLDHHPKYKQDCSDSLLYALSKMLQTQPYKPPVDPRHPDVIEMDRARIAARAKAERSTRRTSLWLPGDQLPIAARRRSADGSAPRLLDWSGIPFSRAA